MITPGTKVHCLLERFGGGVPLSRSSPTNSAFKTLRSKIFSITIVHLDNPSVLLLIGEQGVWTKDGGSCFIPGKTWSFLINLNVHNMVSGDCLSVSNESKRWRKTSVSGTLPRW